jgi:hypothetical protein
MSSQWLGGSTPRDPNEPEETSTLRGIGGTFLGVLAAPFVAVGAFVGTIGLGTTSGFLKGLDTVTERLSGRVPGPVAMGLGFIAGLVIGTVAAAFSVVGGVVLATALAVASPVLAGEAAYKKQSFMDTLKSTWKWADAAFKVIGSTISSSFFESVKQAFSRSKKIVREGETVNVSKSAYRHEQEATLEQRLRDSSDSNLGNLNLQGGKTMTPMADKASQPKGKEPEETPREKPDKPRP